jgi:hypothetical protein
VDGHGIEQFGRRGGDRHHLVVAEAVRRPGGDRGHPGQHPVLADRRRAPAPPVLQREDGMGRPPSQRHLDRHLDADATGGLVHADVTADRQRQRIQTG